MSVCLNEFDRNNQRERELRIKIVIYKIEKVEDFIVRMRDKE